MVRGDTGVAIRIARRASQHSSFTTAGPRDSVVGITSGLARRTRGKVCAIADVAVAGGHAGVTGILTATHFEEEVQSIQ